MTYNKYSEYLKTKYGEKVYKLPINLPVTCPNRVDGKACTFCSDKGTGFEAMEQVVSVQEQLEKTKSHIERKYNAHKFIAYFQNYTNTFLPLEKFEENLHQACGVDDIVEVSVSTRPDCINTDYLDVLKNIKEQYGVNINIEMGLQTVNYHTLQKIQRGHSLAEFINAVILIQKYNFTICAHVIPNLPYDNEFDVIETAKILSALQVQIVKIHSLYIAKGTSMARDFENDKFEICTKDDYYERVALFLEHISPEMVVERLFSRIPKEDMVFSNWNTSWWKLQDELLGKLESEERYQGKHFNYLNGAGLYKL